MPNPVLIMPDEQRHDTLGCTGNPVIDTPNTGTSALLFDRAADPHEDHNLAGDRERAGPYAKLLESFLGS